MSKVMRKKVRIKKRNFAIFIVINILIIFTIYKTTTALINTFTKEKKETKKEEVEKKETDKKTDKDKENDKNNDKNNENDYKKDDDKYKELDNINQQIDFFNDEYLDRYIEYKKENKYLPNDQIIKNVNMHLDIPYYENTTPAKQIGTEKILVNKHYYLDKKYVPDNLENISKMYALANMKLVKPAKESFENMAKDAKKNNLSIIAMSTYRSYDYQVSLYNKYVKQDGKDAADTYSGRPGHSEHQTGLAVDVYNGKENYTNFEKTKEFTWMQENAYKYGFILRFPKDKEKETGYQYESWHYRYVGETIATYIHENNISFEEYYATKIKDW